MTKTTVSIICVALLLAAFGMIPLLVVTETAEAVPTKIEQEVYPYLCKKKGPPVVDCLGSPTEKTRILKVHNSLWHRIFGDHPHKTRVITSEGAMVVDYVIDCSECSF